MEPRGNPGEGRSHPRGGAVLEPREAMLAAVPGVGGGPRVTPPLPPGVCVLQFGTEPSRPQRDAGASLELVLANERGVSHVRN